MEQTTLPGVNMNTPLSLAADELLDSANDLQKAKDRKVEAEAKLVEEMQNVNMTTLTHRGYVMTFRKGRVTKDRIAIK